MTSLVAKASNGISSVMRKMGSALDGLGKSIEITQYTEKLVPSTRFVAVDGVAPKVTEAAFVAPSAAVIGDVSLGKSSSVWYGATIRGDVNHVTIGDGTSIGDKVVVHVAKIQGDHPTTIGSGVRVGAGALIHAATLEDGCVIDESAQVLDGATVGSNSRVGPASVVTPKTKIPAGEYWAGSPAVKVRALTPEEQSSMALDTSNVIGLAVEHAIENSKDYAQLMEEEQMAEVEMYRDESMPKDPAFDNSDVLGQGQPGRIFRSTLSHPEEAANQK